MVAPAGAKQVHETWMIYDTCRIGKHIGKDYPGGFSSLGALAGADEVPFFNIRNSSEAGLFYTNVTSKDKIPWPFILESMGIRFVYPDPNISSTPDVDAVFASKFFCHVLAEHCYLKFTIREDDRLIIKPHMVPPGYGPFGFGAGYVPPAPLYFQISGSGMPDMGNRWKWVGEPLKIPADTPIKATLHISKYGKGMLAAMGSVNSLAFGDPEFTDNEAMIEVTLRGKRFVQQRGEYFAS